VFSRIGGCLIRLKIGILGFGNVSTALIKHCLSMADRLSVDYGLAVDFAYICDSRALYDLAQTDINDVLMKKEEKLSCPGAEKTPLDEFYEIIENKRIDMLIDCLPSSKIDAGPTFPLLVHALEKHINVVFVNKAPLVFRGKELFELARRHRTKTGLSGATAGCLPTSGVLVHELAGSNIYRIRGILNSTSNYILDSMIFDGLTLEQAIENAVDLGIAEPDYEYDLNGLDTCFKMIILGLLVTGENKPLKDIERTGILGFEFSDIERRHQPQKLLRLIGDLRIKDHELDISVRLEEIGQDDPLFMVRGKGKGIVFKTRHMGDLAVISSSSGRTNIAAAVLKDIINISRRESG
jgi:homoserine dehydrogenase